MNMVAKATAAACAILAASMMVSAELRQVLVVSRHGVRGPYGPDDLPPTEANMQRYSKNKFPFPVKGTEWGTSNNDAELVTPKITKHGAQVIRRMGEVASSLFYDPWHDSLSEAQFLSEWFLLQSLNNMSLPPSMALDDVVALGAIHKVCCAVPPRSLVRVQAHMDLVTNQFNSENFGSTLLVHLVASMQQTIQQSSPEAVARHRDDDGPHLLQSLSNTFLFYAGHDINLLFLKNLLRYAAGLAIRQACVSPSLAKFAASLLAPTRVPRHSASWAFKVVVVTVLSVSLLLIVWKYIARLNQAKTPVFNRYTALE
ncbi:hypothetical protein DYB32_000991 [Aphanomyces invadans]|uniref:Uncharacterized protein n=1 Tax=Aphanomyces invadans TaxID=157072 RepID=A0A418B853_9STRA|nr:hypothetical protein DYB32_000991 [Aphanomyces invadans]